MDDSRAMELASTQYGLITYDQALAAGWTRHQVQLRLDDRMLHRVHHGVYRFSSSGVSRRQRLLAACLAVGSISAISHRAAASLHGLWVDRDDLIELTVGRDRTPDLVGARVHRIEDLSERWILRVDGVPVTTPARTLVDLGAVLPLGSVGRVLDRALGRRIASIAEVRTAMEAVARKGRAGVGVIRRLLMERSETAMAATVLEARMRSLLVVHALPQPVPEHTVFDEHGQFVGRVDFAYPEIKYAIEVDGYEAHTDPRAFRHDRVRQNDLVDLGWTIHRFTWREVDQLSTRVAERIRLRHRQLLGTLRPARAA